MAKARRTFEWDAENIGHIARHEVTPAEAEYVVLGRRSDLRRSDASTYPITFGPTGTGKYLAVVWSAVGDDPEIIRVIPVPRPRRRR